MPARADPLVPTARAIVRPGGVPEGVETAVTFTGVVVPRHLPSSCWDEKIGALLTQPWSDSISQWHIVHLRPDFGHLGVTMFLLARVAASYVLEPAIPFRDPDTFPIAIEGEVNQWLQVKIGRWCSIISVS